MLPTSNARSAGAMIVLAIALMISDRTRAAARRVDPAGGIAGVVRDTAGRPLPGVQVVLAGLDRGTTTSAEGRFLFRDLRPGHYHLQAILIGYAPAHVDATVTAGGTVQLAITLRISAVQLEGLQVTASATAASGLNTAQATAELAGKELQRTVAATVARTLSSQPGMAVRYAGPATSTPMIRGLSGERILVLQNGERAGDLSGSSQDHALSLDPLAASRIEVVRGPASLLYGNNALGGVVNVISSDMPGDVAAGVHGYLAVQGESATPGGAASGSATLPLARGVALTAQGGYRHLGDLRVGGGDTQANTHSRNGHGSLGLGYVRADLSGGALVQAYRFAYGLPFAAAGDEAGVHIRGQRQQAQARLNARLGERGITALQLSTTAQFYAHDEIEADGGIGTTFELNTQTADASATTRIGRLQGKVGAAGILKQYVPTGEEALTPPAHERALGVFLFQELPLGVASDEAARAARLQLGGRYDVHGVRSLESDMARFGPGRSRSFGSASASLGASVPLGAWLSLGVSAARSYRAPTAEELFSNAFHAAIGAYQLGDPELTPEIGTGIDAILRAQSRRLSGQLAVYHERIGDFIAAVPIGDTVYDGHAVPRLAFRQQQARISGVEGKVEAEVAPGWVVGAMGDALRGASAGGAPLPYMPAARLGGSVRWEVGPYSAGAEYTRAFAQQRVSTHETATGAYHVVTLNAGARLITGGRVQTLSLRLENALDARYREATSRIKDFAWNPGRNVSLVYRVLF